MRCLVLGGAGFLGHAMVKRLKKDGHHVTVIDCKPAPEFEKSPADNYICFDLRRSDNTDHFNHGYDEFYNFATGKGSASHVSAGGHDYQVTRNFTTINLNVLEACDRFKIPKVFFASFAGASYVEHLYQAYAKFTGLQVRIARFYNIFGPLCAYNSGKEKAPAALCRKVCEAENGTSISIWGDGTATRSFCYIDDAVEGVVRLMASDYSEIVDISSSRLISIATLATIIATLGGKMLDLKSGADESALPDCNPDNTLLPIKEVLGWEPLFPLELGLTHTYAWIAKMMDVRGPGLTPGRAAL